MVDLLPALVRTGTEDDESVSAASEMERIGLQVLQVFKVGDPVPGHELPGRDVGKGQVNVDDRQGTEGQGEEEEGDDGDPPEVVRVGIDGSGPRVFGVPDW